MAMTATDVAYREFLIDQTARPSNSRVPSVLTPTAIITATETMRPNWRVFTNVASIHK